MVGVFYTLCRQFPQNRKKRYVRQNPIFLFNPYSSTSDTTSERNLQRFFVDLHTALAGRKAMALKRTFMIGVLLVCGMLTGAAWGQNLTPGTFFDRTPESSQNLPLATPGLFDYDAQVFAPLEFTNGKEKKPNTGLFFELSKTCLLYTSPSPRD